MLFLLVLSLCLFVDASNKSKTICSLCECFVDAKPYLVDCDDLALTEFPVIARDLMVPWRLRLKGNSLTVVPTFAKLDNLTCLSLQSNKISKIEDFAFSNLTNLDILELAHNNLTAESLTSDAFKGPYDDKLRNPLPLKFLDLSYNYINRIPKSLFIHLRNLTKLNLSHNPFVDFSVKTAQAISELHQLTELDLSYTRLQRLPAHFFAELTSLTILDLSGNEFITVPEEVNYARYLRKLTIKDNVFGILYSHSFWESLKNLETLDMSESMSLFRIDDGVFGNLTSLKKLYLNDNPQLSVITSKSFSNKFNETPHLQELYLQNDQFDSLPEAALPWSDIPVLNLQDNPWNCDCKLEWLAKGVMKSMGDSANYDLSLDVTCASPVELMGLRLTDTKVQTTKFVCRNPRSQMGGYGFLVVATIVVGTLLLVTGTILFSYILFRRTKVQDWLGDNVKYRRTCNDDEEIVTSPTQY